MISSNLMMTSLILMMASLILMASLIFNAGQPAVARVKDDPVGLEFFEKGKSAFNAKRYKEAQASLIKAANLAPRNVSIEYYLGITAAANKDLALLERAMSRIVAMTPERSAGAKRALSVLHRYSGLTPYSTVDFCGMVTRFNRGDMPIKIHITNGKMLPAKFRGSNINEKIYVAELTGLANDPNFYRQLPMDPGYVPGCSKCVIAGVKKWDWAVKEKILNYTFVDSPINANIVVLWLPSFKEHATKAFTAYLDGGASGDKKILVQLTTGDVPREIFSQWLVFSACHEFGHCWGLAAHSPSRSDMMGGELQWFFTRTEQARLPSLRITQNDKQTLRALYDITPDSYR